MTDLSPVVSLLAGLAGGLAIARWPRRRRRGSNPPSYGWGPHQLPPPPPAPGMRREYLWSSSQMAECGGPCWEARDPHFCVCGVLWRDVPCDGASTTSEPELPPIPRRPRPPISGMDPPWPW